MTIYRRMVLGYELQLFRLPAMPESNLALLVGSHSFRLRRLGLNATQTPLLHGWKQSCMMSLTGCRLTPTSMQVCAACGWT